MDVSGGAGTEGWMSPEVLGDKSNGSGEIRNIFSQLVIKIALITQL